MNWLLFTIVLTFHLPASYGSSKGVPVIILDNDRVLPTDHASKPLTVIDPETFTEIMDHASQKTKAIIVFLEESLSVEDFSLKDKEGNPYKYIGEMVRSSKAEYYPSVDEPFKRLMEKFKMEENNVFEVTNSSERMRIYPNDLKYIYIIFKDHDEVKRPKLLRRHDRMISEIHKAVQKLTEGHILCFYTAMAAPAETPVLIPLSESDPGVLVKNDAGIFYLKNVVHVHRGTRATLKEKPSLKQRNWTSDGLKLDVNYENVMLQFKFDFWQNYWGLDEVRLFLGPKLLGRSWVGAVAELGTAYACGYPIMVVGEGVSVTIGAYQIMPFKPLKNEALIPILPPTAGETTTSPDSRRRRQDDEAEENAEPEQSPEGSPKESEQGTKVTNCRILFTGPILTGLFCTLIAGSILAWGICMMMDLSTHDKYDDAHGKPLVITTDEHH